MSDWVTIIDWVRSGQAGAAWQSWIQEHDISDLDPDDLRIDYGHGPVDGRRRDFVRYRILREALEQLTPVPRPAESDSG